MKHFPKFILTFILSIIIVFIIGNRIESDGGVVGMAISISMYPAMFIGLVNTLFLLAASEINSSKLIKLTLILIPFLIASGLIIFGDKQLEWIGQFAAISIGIVNTYYGFKILK